MARHNLRKVNQSIMFGVMGMAVVVLLVILLFWYLCIKKLETTPTGNEQPNIEQYDE